MMFVLVRKVLSCLASLWLCVVHALCRRKQREGENRELVSWNKGIESEEKWNTEGWDDFSIKVVPNEEASGHPLQADEPTTSQQGAQQTEQDLFEDMKPVFRKPKKIHLHSQASELKEVNLSKFAVQDSVFRQEVVGELGVWSEDEGAEGWEEELAPDEGHLVHDSQEAIRKKKVHDREKRRKAQEILRNQQRTVNTSLHLGTRVV